MIKQFNLIIRFVVIGLIYIVLFRIIKIMYLDLKGGKTKKSKKYYALEVVGVPDTLDVSRGSVFPVNGTISIGRKDDNSISIDDPYISQVHAEVIVNDGRIFVNDLDSTNGTFVNGKSVNGKQELYTGDKIEIGRITFKVIVEG